MLETVFTTSVPSTEFLDDPRFSMRAGRKCSLKYSYENSAKDYSVIFEELIFDGVESFKCTYYKSCSSEMQLAYDKVLNVGLSEWLSEIIDNLSQNNADAESLKHLRIYFDDGPCYEFICKSFALVREEKKDHLKTLFE